MKRNAVNDSWEYVKLGKQVSASEIQTNKVVYQMYNLFSIVLGVVICLLVFSVCIILFETIVGKHLPAIINVAIKCAIALSSIQAGKSGYNYLRSLFGQRFLRKGLRPMFAIQDSEDSNVGRVFRSTQNNICTIYSIYGPQYYHIYYVKHGIQYSGGVILKSGLSSVEFLDQDTMEVVATDK